MPDLWKTSGSYYYALNTSFSLKEVTVETRKLSSFLLHIEGHLEKNLEEVSFNGHVGHVSGNVREKARRRLDLASSHAHVRTTRTLFQFYCIIKMKKTTEFVCLQDFDLKIYMI